MIAVGVTSPLSYGIDIDEVYINRFLLAKWHSMGFLLANGRTAERVDQDQTARMCSLILLYTLRKLGGYTVANSSIKVKSLPAKSGNKTF